MLDGGAIGLGDTAVLSRDLGRAFGRAVRAVADERGVAPELVGSHGQTVWHHDGDPRFGAATLQLGEGAFVAAEARAPVVDDFRQADIAAGGEGAPLSALVDPELFAGAGRPAAILNLGGIANLTLLGALGDADSLAFDTGPAGSLLDGLARRLLDRPYDEGGEVAVRGRVAAPLLAELKRHPFFERSPPKSTGRDTFGEDWVEALVERARELGVLASGPEDLLATAAELVASTVADALARFAPAPPRRLILAGGGAHHRGLVRALERLGSLEVCSSRACGVDPDAREALVFAALARAAVLGRPTTRRWATGAREGAVLGALHLAAAP